MRQNQIKLKHFVEFKFEIVEMNKKKLCPDIIFNDVSCHMQLLDYFYKRKIIYTQLTTMLLR